ncbi:TonB family protein [Gallaecimonas sp. GXIMD1310]|uniref:TonB family protein n=1 Tax=Gallaecimonas sp. GXIMD1310 TaxID=3131926 RepID=UPI00324AF48C
MRTFILLCGVLATSPALANYNDALNAYRQHDYQTALADFKASAILGHPQAQFNFGVLYYQGQGVEKSLPLAYAWFKAAADNGMKEAKEAALQILSAMPADQRPLATKRANTILALYGKKALTATLFPQLRPGQDSTQSLTTPIKRQNPHYPVRAGKKNISGYTQVMFDVNEAGGVENVHIIDAVPAGIFNKSAVKAMSHWRYSPPVDAQGKPTRVIGLRVRLDYKLEGAIIDSRRFNATTTKLEALIKQGNPAAQYQLAKLYDWRNAVAEDFTVKPHTGDKFNAPALSHSPQDFNTPSGISTPNSQVPYQWRWRFTLDKKGRPQHISMLHGVKAKWDKAIEDDLRKRQFGTEVPPKPHQVYVAKYSIFRHENKLLISPAFRHKNTEELYIDAAKGGFVKAQYQLGSQLLLGQGYQVSRQKGLRWLQMAAMQNDAAAQEALGIALANGNGVNDDWKKAQKWLSLAAQQGRWLAKRELAQLILNHLPNNPTNLDEATKLANEAADNHDDPVTYAVLGKAWSLQHNAKKAAHYRKKARDEAKDRGWDMSRYNEVLAARKL